MEKFCKKCGSELNDSSVFCEECGARVDEILSVNNSLFETYKIDMMNGEFIIRQSQIHMGCLILPTIIIAIGFFTGFITFVRLLQYSYFDPLEAFTCFFNPLTFIGLVWFLIHFIAYSTNDLILTNKRVFGKCGLISTTQMQSPLNKIDSVSYSNGIIGKLIGYGTVKIATASTTFKFRFIRDGQTLYNDIFNQLEASEVEKRNENAKAIVDAMAEKLS